MGYIARFFVSTIIVCASVEGFKPGLNKPSTLSRPNSCRLSLLSPNSVMSLSNDSGDKGCNGKGNPKKVKIDKHPFLRQFNLHNIETAPPHTLMNSAKAVYGPLRTEYQNIYQKLSKLLLFLKEQKDEISLILLYSAFKESSLDKLNLFINSINKKYNISSNFFINHQKHVPFVQKLCSNQSTAYSFLAMILHKDAWVLPMNSRTFCPNYHKNILKKLEMLLKKPS